MVVALAPVRVVLVLATGGWDAGILGTVVPVVAVRLVAHVEAAGSRVARIVGAEIGVVAVGRFHARLALPHLAEIVLGARVFVAARTVGRLEFALAVLAGILRAGVLVVALDGRPGASARGADVILSARILVVTKDGVVRGGTLPLLARVVRASIPVVAGSAFPAAPVIAALSAVAVRDARRFCALVRPDNQVRHVNLRSRDILSPGVALPPFRRVDAP
jgi:hypothetical protein